MGGFSNSVVGGVGTLIRAFIRSVNYVAGVSGWQITRAGSAEFNDITSRGTVIIKGSGQLRVIGTNNAEIDIDPNNLNPQIHFISADGTNDAYINAATGVGPGVADLGLNSGKYTPGDGVVRRGRLYFQDSNDNSRFSVIKESNQTTKGGSITLTSTGAFFGYSDEDGGVSRYLTFQTGPGASITDSIGILNETWHSPGYVNGWAVGGSGVFGAQLVAAPYQGVWICGSIHSPNPFQNAKVWNLAVAYRPAHRQGFAITRDNNIVGFMSIETNGDVLMNGPNTAGVDWWINAIYPLNQ